MENNIFSNKKLLNKRNTKYLLIILVAIFFIAAFFIYFSLKGPATIANCKDLECVRVFASDENFILEDCESTILEFKDKCYYIFGTENPKAKERKVSEYCLPIKDEELYIDCIYHSTGELVLSQKDRRNIQEALMETDKNKCEGIRVYEIKNQCLEDVAKILKAIEEKDVYLCNMKEGLSPSAQAICINKVIEVINRSVIN